MVKLLGDWIGYSFFGLYKLDLKVCLYNKMVIVNLFILHV